VPRPERDGGAPIVPGARPEAATRRIIRSPLSIRKDNYGTYYQPASTELLLIRFHLAAILERKGWTPYRLARETGLTVPTAYRLADPEVQFGRFTADTLDRLCAALDVQPGELLEWVPDTKRRRSRR
jgi:putative transcriptional regulator